MSERPPLKPRKTPLGVHVPSGAPPAPPVESERSFALLKEIHDELRADREATNARLDEHQERLDEHEQRLLAIRKGQIEADDRAQRIEKTSSETLQTLLDMRGTDLDLEKRVAGVEQRLATRAELAGAEAGKESGIEQGRRKGGAWGAFAGLVAAVIVALLEWWARAKGAP